MKLAAFARVAVLRPFAEQLATFAEMGSDPALYADVVVDQALGKGITVEKIKETFSDPNLMVDLAAIVPAVAKNREWFEALREAVLVGIAEEAGRGVVESTAHDPSPERGSDADHPQG